MTLNPSATYLYSKEYPLFCLWAIKRGILFFPRDIAEGKDKMFDLVSKVYILMKRLGQSYETLMNMPFEDFDRFFEMELELMEEEERRQKELENKK